MREQKRTMEGVRKGATKEGRRRAKAANCAIKGWVALPHGWMWCTLFFSFLSENDRHLPFLLKSEVGTIRNKGRTEMLVGPHCCRMPVLSLLAFCVLLSDLWFPFSPSISLSLLGSWCISLFSMVLLLCSIEWCWNVLLFPSIPGTWPVLFNELHQHVFSLLRRYLFCISLFLYGSIKVSLGTFPGSLDWALVHPLKHINCKGCRDVGM